VLRAPCAGRFLASASIGELVGAGDSLGEVDGSPVRAATSGLLRGLIADGVVVELGDKLGDVDPRGRAVDPARISDKARAVAAGVLEAVTLGLLRREHAAARERGARMKPLLLAALALLAAKTVSLPAEHVHPSGAFSFRTPAGWTIQAVPERSDVLEASRRRAQGLVLFPPTGDRPRQPARDVHGDEAARADGDVAAGQVRARLHRRRDG
jgi:hypothetical protein